MDLELILSLVRSRAEELGALSDAVWAHPETAFRESFACAALGGHMAARGFSVETGVGGLDTAFRASWGEGSPAVGFLAEYDALPGLSQEAGADERREREPGGPGHGCGHHLLGAGAAGAAVALKEYLQRTGGTGTVVLFGCPAEESGAGKEILGRAGVFDGLDLCFAWHPDTVNCAVGTASLANIILRAGFRGVASHAAAAPERGRSALDACELMNVGANYLREHIPDAVRLHYAYTNSGGASPNVVPEAAELLYYVRAPKIAQARDVAERLHRVAQGAALMTDTALTWTVESEMLDYLPCHTLNRVLDGVLRRLDPPFRPSEPYADSGPCRSISTDVGNVSWLVPTGQLFTACFTPGTHFHTWQMTAQGCSREAKEGMLAAAAAMACAGAAAVEDQDLICRAREEWSAARAGSL